MSSEFTVTLRLGVYRQSVRLGDNSHKTHDHNFYFLTEHLRLYSLRNILSDERTGLSFTIAAGPRQRSSFSGPSPAGLMAIVYCLRFETLPTWRARSQYLYLPGNGGPVIPPGIELNQLGVSTASYIEN
jgi:hypothetical protein